MANKADMRSLVAYVISRLSDMEASFGKTKLVKLLYLIDVEFYKSCSKKMTGFEWIFYHYGPYTPEIESVLTQLDFEIPQEDVVTATGYTARIFDAPKGIDTAFEKTATPLEKTIVDRVLGEWGLEELNPLLSYVYFHTEPMKDVRRGDMLDFSKIVRPTTSVRAMSISITSHKELRDSFMKIKGQRSLINYESLTPKPRIDRAFISSMSILENDEKYIVPKGEVQIQEDSKERFREQTG